MKHLNTKGFTTVEVLICFVIVSVVMMSMFSTISAFNEKKNAEANRAKIYEFKNNVTNVIQEDLIKKGLVSAKIQVENDVYPNEGDSGAAFLGMRYTLDLTLRDGDRKRLIVFRRYVKTNYRINGKSEGNDIFFLRYGTVDLNGNPIEMIQYDLPDLGSEEGFYAGTYGFLSADDGGVCHDFVGTVKPCQTIQLLQINNVSIGITNEADVDVSGHVLYIYIGFYHPDFGTKYAINITSPVDFQSSQSNSSATFPTTSSNSNSTSSIYMR